MEPEIIQMNQNTWRIEDQGVRFFLLCGTKEALLVDSGMTTTDALAIVQKLTDLPIKLLNTHADRDHIAGNAAFQDVYMHPAEFAHYQHVQHGTGKLHAVFDGDVIDLGDRPLQVIGLAGHTPGSLALLDVESRFLISGDPIQDGRIFMFGPQRDLAAYYQSLERLWQQNDRFDWIYPSHATCPISKEIILPLIDGAKAVLAGQIEGQPVQFKDHQIVAYDIGCASFLCDQ